LDSQGGSMASADSGFSDGSRSYSSSGSSSSGNSLKAANREHNSEASMDSGLGSMSSSGTYTTEPKSVADETSSFQKSSTKTVSPIDEPVAKFETFLLFCQWLVSYKPKWTDWTPNTDIRGNLNPTLVAEGRKLLWDQPEDQEGDFEALNAARDGDENVVALAVLLAPHHKQLNTMNHLRQTLLHVASENKECSAKLVRLIITRGADGAIPDVWGNTPLHIACEYGRADVITALTLPLTKPEVRHPFYKCPYKSLPQDNVNSYNHDGRAPVHLAAESVHSLKHREAVAAMHMYAKCNMDYRRLGDGYSASHIAIDNDDEECLQVCLEAKADSEVRNYKGETPQQLAYLCGSHRMVELCQKFGAGEYQLEHADTEPVVHDYEEDMETQPENDVSLMNGELSHRLRGLAV